MKRGTFAIWHFTPPKKKLVESAPVGVCVKEEIATKLLRFGSVSDISLNLCSFPLYTLTSHIIIIIMSFPLRSVLAITANEMAGDVAETFFGVQNTKPSTPDDDDGDQKKDADGAVPVHTGGVGTFFAGAGEIFTSVTEAIKKEVEDVSREVRREVQAARKGQPLNSSQSHARTAAGNDAMMRTSSAHERKASDGAASSGGGAVIDGKYSRLAALVNSMQRDISTYCDEPADAKHFREWYDRSFFAQTSSSSSSSSSSPLPPSVDVSDEGDNADTGEATEIGANEKKKEKAIAAVLESNDFMTDLESKLVPSIVSRDTFWARYFYRLELLEEQENRRTELINRAATGTGTVPSSPAAKDATVGASAGVDDVDEDWGDDDDGLDDGVVGRGLSYADDDVEFDDEEIDVDDEDWGDDYEDDEDGANASGDVDDNLSDGIDGPDEEDDDGEPRANAAGQVEAAEAEAAKTSSGDTGEDTPDMEDHDDVEDEDRSSVDHTGTCDAQGLGGGIGAGGGGCGSVSGGCSGASNSDVSSSEWCVVRDGPGSGSCNTSTTTTEWEKEE